MIKLSLLRGLLPAASLSLSMIALPAAAQQLPPPGTPPSQIQRQIDALGLRGQLLARIQSSGMTPEQIRSRLASMGYDPRTLDPYLTSDTTPPPPPSTSTVEAIRALGMPELVDSAAVVQPGAVTPGAVPPGAVPPSVIPPGGVQLGVPAGVTQPGAIPPGFIQPAAPAAAPLTEKELRLNLRVFGVEVFGSGGTTQFDPVLMGAVPPDYVLGPGDELVLVLTGDVQFTHTLPVTREGFILIPQVGQVWVNGLTRDELIDQLYTRLAQVYSGISRGADATTHFDVSIARLRTNQVYISGEVVRPGSYTVSPLASVLNALYQAGGPTGNGSFREVHILRGGRVVHEIDLYEFLLRGDNLDRVRLDPGDVVFVPVHGKHVSVRGEVVRDAIFELKPNEGLLELIAFAGGTTAPAHLRARLTRVLPPAQRTTPGVDRVVIDIDLAEAMTNPAAAPRLAPDDDLEVLPVTSVVRNMVSVSGSVWRPGSYGFHAGMRVSELLDAGGGLTPEAFAEVAHISRINPADSSLILIPFTLRRDASGNLVENPVLEEFDVVTVYSRGGRTEELPIQVSGEVQEQVVERFQEGMTLRDAIIRAGGLRRTADPVVEVARLADPAQREQGGIAQIFRVPVDSTYFVSDEAARHYLGDPAALRAAVGGGEAAEFLLQPHDRIYVRKIPQFELPRVVTVTGEVRYPGTYSLQRKDERVRELLLGRVGGLGPTAHVEGFRLYRNRNLVNVDLAGVLEREDHPDNLNLLPGDSMFVPEYNPVVIVQGAVNSPTAVLYKAGANLQYYISNAGGYARNADRARVHVRYANGSGRVTERGVFFRSQPTPEPGSVVTVPLTPQEERTDTRALISDIAQILGVLATVALVALR